MLEIRYFRVEELPPVLVADAVYYVSVGDKFDKYITNSEAVVVTVVPADIRVKQDLGDSVHAVMSQDAITRAIEQAKTEGGGGTPEQIKQLYESNPNTNAFTTSEKDKLAFLESSKFRGTYISHAALLENVQSPTAGDYADVDAGVGEDTVRYIWDNTDAMWVYQQSSTSLTSAQVKQMYESNPNTNTYDDASKNKLDGVMFEATKNDPDPQLRARSTHTGTQDVSTITGLGNAALHNYRQTANTVMQGNDPRVATSVTRAELDIGLAGKAPVSHTHSVSSITGLGTAATTAASDYAIARGRIVADPNAILDSGMYGVDGNQISGAPSYSAMIVARNVDTGLQIAGGYNTDSILFRGYSGSGTAFTPWRTMYHNGNQLNLGVTPESARVAMNLGTMATEPKTSYSTTAHTHQWDTIGGKPIVQGTGQSTTAIMSQKAVTDALGGTGGTSGTPDRNNILFDGVIKTAVEFDHISVSNSTGYAIPASPLSYSAFVYPGGFSCKSPSNGSLYTYYTPTGISVGTTGINTMQITTKGANGMYGVQFKSTVHVDGGLFAGESIGTGTYIWTPTLQIRNGATNTAVINSNGVASFVDVNITSDARYKSNKKLINSSLDKITKISGYTYNIHESIDGENVGSGAGVLAQDLRDVLPECVTENESGKLSVAYSGVIALLVESIKELNAKVAELERNTPSKGE